MIKNKRRQDKIPRKVKKARSGKYKFSVRTHPIQGIISFALGVISLLIFIILCVISGNTKGTSGLTIGAIGVLAMFTSILGFILAMIAVRKRDIRYCFPIAGGILNGVLTIVYFGLYVSGMI